jgi:hypothetical protein
MTMHFLHGVFVRRLDETEYILTGFIDPIGHAIASMFALVKEVFAVGFGHVPGFDAGDGMDIHI